jgi:hypothetical protein
MRKLGFVLVALLAITLVGAAYADPYDPLGYESEVDVKVTVAEWAKLTADDSLIDIDILEPSNGGAGWLYHGATSGLQVESNFRLMVKVASVEPTDGCTLPEPSQFQFFIIADEDGTAEWPTEPWRSALPHPTAAQGGGHVWCNWDYYLDSGNMYVSDGKIILHPGDEIPILYAVAVDEMPEAGTEYNIQVVYQLCEAP